MIAFLKKSIPGSIKSRIRALKALIFDRPAKLVLVRGAKDKQKKLICSLGGKKQIRVAFLAIHRSVWKVDPVFRQMLADPYFAPEIIVCPCLSFDEKLMMNEMEETHKYFLGKAYPVRKALNVDGTWVALSEIGPDLIFFTNPHNLTRREYYQNAYSQYLCCYVPYYYMATNHGADDRSQLNTDFMNSLWRFYLPHDFVSNQFMRYSTTKGSNGLLTGYPATEDLIHMQLNTGVPRAANPWKQQEGVKKKIIYAPHHTISEEKSSLSTFLKFALLIQELAMVYNTSAQWSFKPHPLLKSKLYKHPDWGREKTDDYYHFWRTSSFAQLDEGEYEELFSQSDAIIHDCSSFIVEYAFTKSPALFLLNASTIDESFLNEFGAGVMRSYSKASHADQIIEFIEDVISESYSYENVDTQYFDDYVSRFYGGKLPSTRILEDIKDSLGVDRR